MKKYQKEKVDLVAPMSNITFTPSSSYHIELWFAPDYTMDSIVDSINDYVHHNQLFNSQTQLPPYYRIFKLKKSRSVLW